MKIASSARTICPSEKASAPANEGENVPHATSQQVGCSSCEPAGAFHRITEPPECQIESDDDEDSAACDEAQERAEEQLERSTRALGLIDAVEPYQDDDHCLFC